MEKGFKKAGEACFWAALFIELVIVVIEKSAYTNPYESLVFRLTFLLFCIKILSTKYTRGEWLVIILCGGLAVLSYWINERDETVRAAVLVAACKDVDLKKRIETNIVSDCIGQCSAICPFCNRDIWQLFDHSEFWQRFNAGRQH